LVRQGRLGGVYAHRRAVGGEPNLGEGCPHRAKDPALRQPTRPAEPTAPDSGRRVRRERGASAPVAPQKVRSADSSPDGTHRDDDGCVVGEAPLTDRHRRVVWMRILEGRTSAEVAQILGTTAGNVDVILHRSLPNMRKAQT
jgi:DNA-directed RNA polymerase specialized sigma24 family protein